MNDLSRLDIVLIIAGGILILRGFVRGFLKEFFSLGAPVLGLLGSLLLHKNAAAFLRENYLKGIRWLPEILGFIAIFVIIYLLSKVVQKLLNDIIRGLSLDSIDKVLGLVFGLAEALVLVSAVLFLISIQPVFNADSLLSSSVIANSILPLIIDTSKEALKTIKGASAFLKSALPFSG